MAQNPVITITMDNGDVIKAELYPEIAPVSVNNFISLVKKGFYDGLTFHRVIEGSWSRAAALWEMVPAVLATPSAANFPRMASIIR